eukprot:TRINITY_DN12789_c0_g1_i1.p1 TRINITY_DN12789_c0_g1~~TRINITY_DN12789_c0_g1_i1.p1  ORF type:complete len:279 (-),score=52.31 TRINITY_DN12789_c0_g1_i1:31-867(-)
MGYPISEHLLKTKKKLIVWNRTKSKAMPLGQIGAEIVDTPQEALSQSQIIISMLFDLKAIEDVILTHPHLLKGKTFIQMSTLSPQQNLKIKNYLNDSDLNVTFIESPVLGTDTVAKAAKLQILMATETQSVFDQYAPLFTCLGTPHYIGAPPSASMMKLAMNNLVVGQTTLFANSLALVKRSGLSEETFMNILRPSAFHCAYYDFKMPAMLERNYQPTHWDISGAKKDIGLVKNECERLDIDTSVVEGFKQLIEKTAERYEGKEQVDFAVVYDTLNPK